MNKKTEVEILEKGCRGCGRHQDEKPSDCSELFCLWDYGVDCWRWPGTILIWDEVGL